MRSLLIGFNRLETCCHQESEQLHDQDEGLVDATLTSFVPALHAAPDGDERAGKRR
jgi:hypothetical protein